MAALDFPDTPTLGQLYGSAGIVWRWDGTRWASTSGVPGGVGEWVPFAPAWAGLTLGDGVQKVMKRYVGPNHIDVMGSVDFGVSTTVTGGLSFPIPDGRVAAAGIGLVTQPIGSAVYTNVTGPMLVGTNRNNILFRVHSTAGGVAGSYLSWVGLSPTVPVAWTSNDLISFQVSIPLEPA